MFISFIFKKFILTLDFKPSIKTISTVGEQSMITRKSTQKYHVIHASSGVKVIENVSKTNALKFAKEMSGNKKGSFIIRAAIDCK